MFNTPLILTLTSLQIQVEVTKTLSFLHTFCMMGGTLFLPWTSLQVKCTKHFIFYLDLLAVQGHKTIRFLNVFVWQVPVVLCVIDSTQTASPISTYLQWVPVSCMIISDVQHTCCFYLDLFADAGQGHTHQILNFRAWETYNILVNLVKYYSYNGLTIIVVHHY